MVVRWYKLICSKQKHAQQEHSKAEIKIEF